MISKKIIQSIYKEPSEWISVGVIFIIGFVASWIKGDVGAGIFVLMLCVHVIVISDIFLCVFKKGDLSIYWAILALITGVYLIGLFILGQHRVVLVFNLMGIFLSAFILAVFYFARKK